MGAIKGDTRSVDYSSYRRFMGLYRVISGVYRVI